MASDSVYGVLFNADSAPFTNGMVLRISGNQRAVRALADTAPHVQGLAGVNASGVVGIGGPANVATVAANQKVLLETGLTPVAGQTLYVSATVAGRATNVAPAIPVAIGTIANVGSYAQDARVFATVVISSAAASAFLVPVVLRTVLNDNLLATGVRSFVGTPVVTGKRFYSLGRWGIEIANKSGVASGSMIVDVEVNGVDMGPTGVTFASAAINVLTNTTSTYFNNGVGMPGGAGIDIATSPLDINVTTAFGGLATLTGNFVMYGYFA